MDGECGGHEGASDALALSHIRQAGFFRQLSSGIEHPDMEFIEDVRHAGGGQIRVALGRPIIAAATRREPVAAPRRQSGLRCAVEFVRSQSSGNRCVQGRLALAYR